jgi:two-component system sensor histidine kinase KdpD
LRELASNLSEAEKTDLLTTILEEGERLNRFIANLLDMTRLESGAVMPNVGLYDVSEIVDSALRRAAKILARHHVEVRLATGLPMVELDPVLFEQVLFNLFDNAAKYTPADTTICIETSRDADAVCLRVFDEGKGIPDGDLERIFGKFYRAQKGDRVRAGTGLGLAISRGFVEALNGAIVATNRADRSGAVFTIRLPIWANSRELGSVA